MQGIITKYRRKKFAEITSGSIIQIPKVAFIAFGNGAEMPDGSIKEPTEIQEELFNEVKRYPIFSAEIIGETTVKYTVEIPESDMKNVKINEAALVDLDGKIVAIKTFGNKVKDEDTIFIFEFHDEY